MMKMNMQVRVLLSGFSFLVVGIVGLTATSMAADDPQIVNSSAFLAAHPDQRWHSAGEEAYRRKRYGEAFGYFKDAARYAEKKSQAMVAEMLWNGEGVERNRPLAYAWIDLAAERGYRPLVVVREQYWGALSVDERRSAVDAGKAIYAEFADDVAKPRLEKELAQARLQITGSHLGHVGTLAVPEVTDTHGDKQVPMNVRSPGQVTDGSQYFASRYWEPQEYWRWQDAQWQAAD